MIHTIDEYLHFFIDQLGGVAMTPTEFRASVLRQPAAKPIAEMAGSLSQ
jgi:hypothetical protein